MKRTATPLFLLLSLTLPAPALQQESGGASEASATSSLAEELKALEKEYSTAVNELFKAMRQLEESEQPAYYEEHKPDVEAYVVRFFDLAERAAGTEVALGAHLWVLQKTQDEENFLISMDVLMRDHLDDDRLAEACQSLAYREDGVAFLEEILAESRNPAVRGNACLALGSRLADALNWGEAEDGVQEDCERYLERVVAEFAEVPARRGGTLGEAAERKLFAVRNLVIGKVAPDIEGVDLGGVAFKLSDYRGKVVLLDFWGHW